MISKDSKRLKVVLLGYKKYQPTNIKPYIRPKGGVLYEKKDKQFENQLK